MYDIRGLAIAVVFMVVFSTYSASADPIQPHLTGLDLDFSYSSVSYDCATQTLSGSATYAVTSFKPVLAGTAYPVYNLDNNPGAAFSLIAVFDHLGTEFDVDGFFTTPGLSAPDLVITGKIPALGMDGSSGGKLIEADVMDLQMYGSAGSAAFSLNGYFRVTGGDLVTEGYIDENDIVGMASWVTAVNPSPSKGFAFDGDFSTTTHMGEVGSIPEPATIGLVALAGGVLAALRRRRG